MASQRRSFKPKKSSKFNAKDTFGVKKKKWQIEDEEIEKIKSKYGEIDCSKVEKFDDLPLSDKTRKGLSDGKFSTATKIQKQSIGLALQGNDILGAAKTGSGKTLAFLIPVLESLYCRKWTAQDGLGALIISPTRELAYQIFEVLRKVGKYQDLSAGLVIGGKHLREEADRINTTNIVICTPGRLLQHMDETAYFNADNLQILVLDEADRILDMGFQLTINGILENLPQPRQTLLFSATQTKSVRDLARLSLKNPVYVSVHENAQHSTPAQLQQSYLVCNIEDKLNLIWSFVKNHLKSKTLVFMSSCKQVRYVYEVFRRTRPGVPVLCLHGAMQQMKRMEVYNSFVWKQHAVLFATDIAARGLDFPSINWVIQLDCPEDANTYIHRAGRTARYEKDGEALLILLPSEEEGMVEQLQTKKIPINKIKINPKKQRTIQQKMESLLAADVELKSFAQRAFMSYVKSTFYMGNKKVFDVTKLKLDEFAKSLGLAVTPRVRMLEKHKKQLTQKEQMKLARLQTKSPKTAESSPAASLPHTDGTSSDSDDSADSDSESDVAQAAEESEEDSSEELLTNRTEGFDNDSDEDADGDFDALFRIKSREVEEIPEVEDDQQETIENPTRQKTTTKYAAAKKILKKNLKVNTKVVFNDEGEAVRDAHKQVQIQADDGQESELGGIDLSRAKTRLKQEDAFDKQLYRDKIKLKHREQRLKDKEERRQKQREKRGISEDMEAVLGNGSEEEGYLDPVLGRDVQEYGSESDPEESYNSADEDRGPPAKRRRPTRRDETSDVRGDSSEEDQSMTSDNKEEEGGSWGDDLPQSGHSLADTELMALQLLQNS